MAGAGEPPIAGLLLPYAMAHARQGEPEKHWTQALGSGMAHHETLPTSPELVVSPSFNKPEAQRSLHVTMTLTFMRQQYSCLCWLRRGTGIYCKTDQMHLAWLIHDICLAHKQCIRATQHLNYMYRLIKLATVSWLGRK